MTDDTSESPIQQAAQENIEQLEREMEELREQLPSLDPMELDAEQREIYMEYDRKAFAKQQLEKVREESFP